MKYIMMRVKHKTFTQYVPIIFPNALVHSLVAKAIKTHIGMGRAAVVSAGEIQNGKILPGSTSTTLNLSPVLPRDQDIIDSVDYGGDMLEP